jgi:REP element-mobilizing transposase RayT
MEMGMPYAVFPHAEALRRGRVSLPDHVYHVTAVTRDRQPLFSNLWAGRCVVHALIAGDADTLAYVVMPDHLHWLLRLRRVPLSRVVQRMKSLSARAANLALGRGGAVWQAGYLDHALRQDEDLRGVARYIAANPLRAGLVDNLLDYPLWDACWMDSPDASHVQPM